jgi:hypothetical protein
VISDPLSNTTPTQAESSYKRLTTLPFLKITPIDLIAVPFLKITLELLARLTVAFSAFDASTYADFGSLDILYILSSFVFGNISRKRSFNID